jgi:hypothetical protein
MLDKELNTSFLESYSQNFARQTSDSFFSRQTHITGKEITSFCDIMQVNLLVLNDLFGNWQQETSRLRSPYFDFEAAEVTEALEQFMNTLSRYIKVDREHFAPLAASAAAQTLRLTLKPYDYFRDTFRQMTIQPVALETIKSRLKFYQINKFLLQETVQRLESEGIEEVSTDSLMIVFDGVYASRKEDLEVCLSCKSAPADCCTGYCPGTQYAVKHYSTATGAPRSSAGATYARASPPNANQSGTLESHTCQSGSH